LEIPEVPSTSTQGSIAVFAVPTREVLGLMGYNRLFLPLGLLGPPQSLFEHVSGGARGPAIFADSKHFGA